MQNLPILQANLIKNKQWILTQWVFSTGDVIKFESDEAAAARALHNLNTTNMNFSLLPLSSPFLRDFYGFSNISFSFVTALLSKYWALLNLFPTSFSWGSLLELLYLHIVPLFQSLFPYKPFHGHESCSFLFFHSLKHCLLFSMFFIFSNFFIFYRVFTFFFYSPQFQVFFHVLIFYLFFLLFKCYCFFFKLIIAVFTLFFIFFLYLYLSTILRTYIFPFLFKKLRLRFSIMNSSSLAIHSTLLINHRLWLLSNFLIH